VRRCSAPARHAEKAQAYVELVLVLPVLILMILGLVEAVFFLGRYLDLLDLTREASRFASVRDPFALAGDRDCSTPGSFDFYYDASCIFSPPTGSTGCTDPAFCNGLNSYLDFDPAHDDVVISVFTISGNRVTNVWPSPNGYWALSNNDSDAAHSNNWMLDCQDNQVRTQPYYTAARIEESLSSGSQPSKGFVTVEVYYCYHQVLNLPFFNLFLNNPTRINAYTLMSLPAGAPSATPHP
jgi:hypothetical protein